jgi:putative nucleotidyltransferase with HDIG domain
MNEPKLPPAPREIIDAFKKDGFQCFAVGGAVRDLLMNKLRGDWDFTTSALPEEILKLFPENSFYENMFGTVGVKVQEDGQDRVYEITTFRTETGYSDRRHPDRIEWGKTIEDDLKRRDFTINAIAFDGENVIDPHGGKKDIEQKLIRAVGEPAKRFEEDALRLIRAVRIASQLGFTIEEQTLAAIQQNAELIKTVANERIRDELMKLLASENPADGVLLLKQTGLLYQIFPEFEEAFATDQKSPERHHKYDVGTHLVESLRNTPSKDPIVRLATLLHDIGKPQTFAKTPEGITTFYNHEIVGTTMVKDIAERLRFSKKDIGRLIRLVRWHQFSVDEHQTDSAIRRIIRNIGKENLQDMLDLRTGDRLGGGARETSWRLELFKKRLDEVQQQPFSVTDLKIDGKDVMETLNIKPGPKVGEILTGLFNEVVEGKIQNEREELLGKLTNQLKSQ